MNHTAKAFTLPLCATALALLTSVPSPARGALVCSVTAKLTAPTRDDDPTSTPGSREVTVTSEHTLAITGGTANQLTSGEYDYKLLVNSEEVAGAVFPTLPDAQVGLIRLDANGEWRNAPKLSAKRTLTFQKHTFKAVTNLSAGGASDGESDEKTYQIGLTTTPRQEVILVAVGPAIRTIRESIACDG